MTGRPGSVVVIGRHDDSHFGSVGRACVSLGYQVHAIPLGLERTEYSVVIDNARAELGVADVTVNLDLARSSYLVFLPFAVSRPEWVHGVSSFEAREWSSSLRSIFSIWGSSNSRGWSLRPDAISLQDSKPFLLHLADELCADTPIPGWALSSPAVPETRGGEQQVLKCINAWQEISGGRFLNTSFIGSRQLQSFSNGSLGAPIMVQDYVAHNVESRLYLSGDRYVHVSQRYELGASMVADLRTAEPTGADVDSGLIAEVPWMEGLRTLMDALDVRYCSFDLAEAEAGRVLLDVNPVGSWTFLEKRYGIDITTDIVEGLLS